MNFSPYFHELLGAYTAELGDLKHDSEGRNVLAKRLAQKREQFPILLGMLDVDPVMVAPVFHGAFAFQAGATSVFRELLCREPDEFGSWYEVATVLEVADWARPMLEQALGNEQGETFLTTVAALEFAWARIAEPADDAPAGRDREEEREDEDDEDDEGDDERRVDDYLEGQGFDRRSAD